MSWMIVGLLFGGKLLANHCRFPINNDPCNNQYSSENTANFYDVGDGGLLRNNHVINSFALWGEMS